MRISLSRTVVVAEHRGKSVRQPRRKPSFRLTERSRLKVASIEVVVRADVDVIRPGVRAKEQMLPIAPRAEPETTWMPPLSS